MTQSPNSRRRIKLRTTQTCTVLVPYRCESPAQPVCQVTGEGIVWPASLHHLRRYTTSTSLGLNVPVCAPTPRTPSPQVDVPLLKYQQR
ncbi:hypothetical protein DFP72DRAFT_1048681 [Ephemerocybe angulata]|uniref:Uncharacterized protein n=1 Tax=Ephemerocybe angulata TaxID=980116 RepID=A0A8H6HMW6_9AGAR|nr:hypothetical protein DFP72DRAFT_1048681 [Tulosesus angulatus]